MSAYVLSRKTFRCAAWLVRISGLLILSILSGLWFAQDGIGGAWILFAISACLIGYLMDETLKTAIAVGGGMTATGILFIQAILPPEPSIMMAASAAFLFLILSGYGFERRQKRLSEYSRTPAARTAGCDEEQ